jgi:RNA polymerase sigma factor (sigma-70 family)
VPSLQALPASDLPASIIYALEGRGVTPLPSGAEGPEEYERRVETALMALFRDLRSDAAFEALYNRTRRMLLAWILHLLGTRGQESDPVELLQDTYVNVYRYAGGFKDEGDNSFRGWARTIAANVVRRARMRRGISLEAMSEGARQVPDGRCGPEQTALVKEEQNQLRRAWALLLLHYAQAFAKLSPRDRQALHLIEVEGLSYTEAGVRLEVGRSNMKMIMFRSRRRIRGHILRAMAAGAQASKELTERVAG